MIPNVGRYVLIVMAAALILGLTTGCGSNEEKGKTAKPVMAPGPADKSDSAAALTAGSPAVSGKQDNETEIAVEVDGVRKTKSQLNAEMNENLAKLGEQIPADKREQAKAEIRKELIDRFVDRTLLNKEAAARNITATEEEIAKVKEGLKSHLPPGMTMDEFIKKNQVDTDKMRDEIVIRIKVNKLVEKEMAEKGIKISDKDINDFYEKNKDQFKQPETVHARHILVSKSPEDKEKDLMAKRTKAEDLRKKLLGGADFADLAARNSDCPSKQTGGDLGTFTRGQMVKPFEDAAFSQKKNAIGPVVETDFGFHIIQVLDHQASRIVKLDKETKQRISVHLDKQKRQNIVEGILKRLKAAANIVVYGT